MAKGNDLGFVFEMEFEEFSKVESKLDEYCKKLNTSSKNDVQLNLDSDKILKAVGDLSNRISQTLQKNKKGELIDVSKFRADTGQIITVIKNLTKDTQQIKLSVNYKEIEKAKEKAQEVKKEIKEVSELSKTTNGSQFADQISATGTKSYRAMVQNVRRIKEEIDSLASVSYKVNPQTGEIEKAVINYTNHLGKAVTETMSWRKETDEAGNVISKVFQTTDINVKSNIDTLTALENKAKNLKRTLTSQIGAMTDNKLIDSSVLANFQKQINQVSMKAPKDAIASFQAIQAELNKLGGNEAQIVRVQKALDSLVLSREKLNNKYPDLIKSEDVAKMDKMEADLTSLLNKLQSGGSISGKSVGGILNTVNNGFATMTEKVKNSSKAIAQTKQDVAGFGSALKTMAGQLGIFSIVNTAFMRLRQGIREGISSVTEIDSAIRDLNRVTEEGEYNITEFTESANKMAISLGHSTAGVTNSYK